MESNPTNPDSTGTTTNTVTLSGKVVNFLTGLPVTGATIQIISTYLLQTAQTNSQGNWSAEFELSTNANLTLITNRSGFTSDTTAVFVQAGSTVSVPDIELTPSSTGGGGTPVGNPVSIFLQSITSDVIGVRESGAQETTQLTFVVVDSLGTPMDLDHAVSVSFRIGAGPGGGEFLSTSSTATNNLGQAIVNLTSGTKAGVVQVIAEIFTPSHLISQPVPITIHGGLPDLNHFSIAAEKLNFPGYNIYGLTDVITAFVGDKYSNPVVPNTAVYFSTTGGIIEGSTLTNDLGQGSVNLISADPRPYDENLGAGFATITASTIDDNNTTISKQTIVLFSGVPMITINPTTFNIPNGGSQSFTYYVGDQNGNPLAGGTNISVTVAGTDVDKQGETSVQLPDTQSQLWTQFSFTVFDKNDTVNVAKTCSITINSTGPNGDAQISIQGTTH